MTDRTSRARKRLLALLVAGSLSTLCQLLLLCTVAFADDCAQDWRRAED